MNQRLAAFRRTIQANLVTMAIMNRPDLVRHLEEDHGFSPENGHGLMAENHPDPRGWHQVLHEDYAFPHDHDPAELAHNPWNLEEWA